MFKAASLDKQAPGGGSGGQLSRWLSWLGANFFNKKWLEITEGWWFATCFFIFFFWDDEQTFDLQKNHIFKEWFQTTGKSDALGKYFVART